MTSAAIADLLEPYLAEATSLSSAPLSSAPLSSTPLPTAPLPTAPLPTAPLPTALYDQLAVYLDLLLKWNAQTNLTAIRSPEEIVRRHFGESLFAGLHLPASATLLDFGSGAGFPGLPIQLLHPGLSVTLGESQNKKASFLREVIRSLQLPTQVWASRVESMPAGTRFDTVTLRAVDRMEQAIAAAAPIAGRHVVLLATASHPQQWLDHFSGIGDWRVPGSEASRLLIYQRSSAIGDREAP